MVPCKKVPPGEGGWKGGEPTSISDDLAVLRHDTEKCSFTPIKKVAVLTRM